MSTLHTTVQCGPDCPGCLDGQFQGSIIILRCNECGIEKGRATFAPKKLTTAKCEFTNPHYPNMCMSHFTKDGRDHVAMLCDVAVEELQDYIALLERGLSAHEARDTVWPSVELADRG